ncbi:nitroreductase family protein [Lentzea tibetensis]|nr:nitroreductase family protein [Lentzea tibetensis]
MDALDAIMTTRAIRRFTTVPVSDEDIWTCLRAAQQAPSGGNRQVTRYLVVTDPDLRREIGEYYRKSYDTYTGSRVDTSTDATWTRIKASARHLADHLADVPVLVFFLMPADRPGNAVDIGPLTASVYPAVQNFCLAARTLGLGTTLTTVIRAHHAEVLELLGVPDGYEVAAMVPLGHPTGSFGVAKRRDVADVTRWNQWS